MIAGVLRNPAADPADRDEAGRKQLIDGVDGLRDGVAQRLAFRSAWPDIARKKRAMTRLSM